MKLFSILFILTMITACNDASRNRLSACKNSTGKAIVCSEAYSIDATTYRKQYIAQVTVPVTVGQTSLALNDSEYSEDFDQDYNCNVDVSRGTKFTYTVTDTTLTLKNNLASLKLIKVDRLATPGLIGTWRMEAAETTKIDAITEMVFMDLNEVRIKKVCNLKK